MHIIIKKISCLALPLYKAIGTYFSFLGLPSWGAPNMVASNSRDFFLSQFRKPEVQNQVVSQVSFFWRLWESICSTFLSSPLWLRRSLVFMPCGHVTLISTSVFHDLVSCVFLSKFPSSYKDPSHWVKVHPNPGWPHLNLNISTKTPFPHKVTLTGTGDRTSAYLFGRYNSACTGTTMTY